MYCPAKIARWVPLLSGAALLCAACGDSVLVARELETDVEVSNLEPSGAKASGRDFPNPGATDRDFPFRGRGRGALQRRATRQNDNSHNPRSFIDRDDGAAHGAPDAGSKSHD
jgi:hypothetical protein